MWQKLNDINNGHTESALLKVFGGWLVRTVITYYPSTGGGVSCSVAQTFVSDPKHEWEDLEDNTTILPRVQPQGAARLL
jgi:hypothetical protein